MDQKTREQKCLFRELIAALVMVHQNNNWHLHVPIVVRLSDADYDLFEVHGLCVSPKEGLFIMGGDGQWNQLEETDVNFDKMLQAIYKRVITDTIKAEAV